MTTNLKPQLTGLKASAKTTNCSLKNNGDTYVIKATNNELIITNGYSLALIDIDGNILEKGASVGTEIFEAMATQITKSFCNRFKGFTEADFKKPV
jgi:hypothetical protein